METVKNSNKSEKEYRKRRKYHIFRYLYTEKVIKKESKIGILFQRFYAVLEEKADVCLFCIRLAEENHANSLK